MGKKKEVDVLDELKRIERAQKEISRQLREETRIFAAELLERERLGLHGDEAVKHFNDWMMLHGLHHLVID